MDTQSLREYINDPESKEYLRRSCDASGVPVKPPAYVIAAIEAILDTAGVPSANAA